MAVEGNQPDTCNSSTDLPAHITDKLNNNTAVAVKKSVLSAVRRNLKFTRAHKRYTHSCVSCLCPYTNAPA